MLICEKKLNELLNICIVSWDPNCRGVASPKFLGGQKIWVECLTLTEQQYFCLERRFSKHEMTRQNIGGHSPSPGYAYA